MKLGSGRVRRAVIVALVGVLIAGAAIAGVQRLTARRGGIRYITRPVAYADISATVTETGTVNPVNPPGTVQIGSEVSGTIASIKVDYNSRVTKGQVMATLDPTTFQAVVDQDRANLAAAQASYAAALSAVAQDHAAVQSAAATLQQMQANLKSAQATVAKAKAQLALAQLTVTRDTSLLQQGFIAQNQMDTDQTAAESAAQDLSAAQAAVAVAQAQAAAAAAQVRSAQALVTTAQAQAAATQQQIASQTATLRQAQYNLSQTVIRSPMDGIVLARNISVGQTVAASFQTPTLFTLATNLADMQVDTSVDEADVGNVRQGETARISVTAFPNVVFAGIVHAVQLNPTIVSNVVTYDAVVLVHDPQERLKPGMTAQVTIDVGTRTHVLAVPIAALLYRPLTPSAPGVTGNAASPAPVAGAPGSQVTLWVLRNGKPTAVPVVIGLSDGINMEITSGSLHAGDPVVIAQARGTGGRPPGGGAGPGGAPGPGGGPGPGGPGGPGR
jgi:HlyD family secretion protein